MTFSAGVISSPSPPERFSLAEAGPSRGGGVTRVVTRGPGALRGPVETKDIGYEFSCYGL